MSGTGSKAPATRRCKMQSYGVKAVLAKNMSFTALILALILGG